MSFRDRIFTVPDPRYHLKKVPQIGFMQTCLITDAEVLDEPIPFVTEVPTRQCPNIDATFDYDDEQISSINLERCSTRQKSIDM